VRFDENPERSAYFADIPGTDEGQPVEFINQQWHHVYWNYKNHTYITKREHILLDEAREQYGLGWWIPSNPAHLDFETHTLTLTPSPAGSGTVTKGASGGSSPGLQVQQVFELSIQPTHIQQPTQSLHQLVEPQSTIPMDTPMSDVSLATDPSTGMIIDVPGPFHILIPQVDPDSPGLAGPIHHSPAQIRGTQT
jgi:hypothetical protein